MISEGFNLERRVCPHNIANSRSGKDIMPCSRGLSSFSPLPPPSSVPCHPRPAPPLPSLLLLAPPPPLVQNCPENPVRESYSFLER